MSSLALLILAIMVSLPAYASDGTTMANGAAQAITAFSVCKYVTNNSGQSIYIPTTSSGEWSSFYNTSHSGETIAICTCSLPWGGTINDGSSTTAYSSATPSGVTCASVSQTRICTSTTLSGSYTNQSCASGCASQGVTWSTNCSGTVGALSSGGNSSVTNAASGYTGSVTETCTNGSLSQSGASCTASCAGTSQGGYCWYFGAANQSCDTVCAAHGGCNSAGIINYSGSSGSDANCEALATAFGQPTPATGGACTGPGPSTPAGCAVKSGVSTIRCTAPATTCAYAGTWAARFCSCNN